MTTPTEEVGAVVNIVKDSWGAIDRSLPSRLSAARMKGRVADESVLTNSLRVSPQVESKEIP